MRDEQRRKYGGSLRLRHALLRRENDAFVSPNGAGFGRTQDTRARESRERPLAECEPMTSFSDANFVA